MRLVVDTSIVIAGLLKASGVRRLLLNPHAPMMRRRAHLSPEAFGLLLGLVTSQVEVILDTQVRPWLAKAHQVLGERDPGDVPFLATAYAVPCDGLWSDDADFQIVPDVPIWTTASLLTSLGLA